MTSLDYIAVLEQVWTWLESNPEVELKGEDKENINGSGSNKKGWRVYLEPGGHVEDDWFVICAVKPSFLYFGK